MPNLRKLERQAETEAENNGHVLSLFRSKDTHSSRAYCTRCTKEIVVATPQFISTGLSGKCEK